MAGFCFDCINKRRKRKYRKHEAITCLDFCEGCGVEKECVLRIEPHPIFNMLEDLYYRIKRKLKSR